MACLEGVGPTSCGVGLESDCLTIIEVLQEGVVRRAAWSDIYLLTRLLPACSFSHTVREGNGVAHLLAKKACTGWFGVWGVVLRCATGH
jgi:hypothetical protein